MKKTDKCEYCAGYGVWAIGDPSPMGPIDARSMPTKPCPVCGANANPVPTTPEKEAKERQYL